MDQAAGVVAFDLDGTLIKGSTVCVHLADWSGNHDILRLEQLYAEGKITNKDVALAEAAHYRNRLCADARDKLGSLPIISGTSETVQWLRERHFLPIIATITWRFAAEVVQKDHGFEAASGCELAETPDGMLTGEVTKHFDAQDKADFVTALARNHRVPVERVIAIGDSTSDLPMFEVAGLSIALNATDKARKAADHIVDTDDLRDVIPIIQSHFGEISETFARRASEH